jgi:cobaltochelatase CobS
MAIPKPEEHELKIAEVERAKSASAAKYSAGGKPICALCGKAQDDMASHLKKEHETTIPEYKSQFPDYPIEKQDVGTGETLSFKTRKKRKFSVYETFGFWWDDKKKTDKEIEGYIEPGPLTPIVDEGYVFNREYTMVALLGVHLRDKVLTYGPTGSGKTSLWEQISARLNMNFMRINFDGGITRADLVGQYVVKGKTMEFAYGVLPTGMKLPGTILCMDEWDTVSEECSFVLQRPLEQHSQLLVMEKGEEVIELHPDNVIVATANTAGMGDDSGLYQQGTKLQNFSQINRFSLTIILDYLPAKDEEAILMKRFKKVEEIEAEAFVQSGKAVRDAFAKTEVAAPLSTRDLINWAEKYEIWGCPVKAATYCFINRYPLEDQQTIRGLIQRAF